MKSKERSSHGSMSTMVNVGFQLPHPWGVDGTPMATAGASEYQAVRMKSKERSSHGSKSTMVNVGFQLPPPLGTGWYPGGNDWSFRISSPQDDFLGEEQPWVKVDDGQHWIPATPPLGTGWYPDGNDWSFRISSRQDDFLGEEQPWVLGVLVLKQIYGIHCSW